MNRPLEALLDFVLLRDFVLALVFLWAIFTLIDYLVWM